FLIAVGLVVVVIGVLRGITGKAAENLPSLIQAVEPVPGAINVPNQSRIFVDLAAGYTGVLVVDGVELQTISEDELRNVAPGEQAKQALTTVFAEGNATLTFQPVKGAPIESLSEGPHTASVIYWKLTDDRNASRSFTWHFTVVGCRGLASARCARVGCSPPATGSLAVAPPRPAARSAEARQVAGLEEGLELVLVEDRDAEGLGL